MKKPIKVLIVEDSKNDAALLIRALQRGGYDPAYEIVETPEAMSDALNRQEWDLVISDYSMPLFSGLGALKLLQDRDPDLSFILMIGQVGEDVAVEAIKAGAHDYILKSNPARLIPAVERELRDTRARRKNSQNEQALRESRERYRLIVETANEGIWQVDEESRTTFVNQEMAEMLGYTIDEMMGQTPYTFMDEEWSKVVEANMWQHRQGIRGQFEYKYRRKDGTDLWALVSSSPIFCDDGSYAGVIGMHVDITERKQVEEALRLSEEKYRMIFNATGTVAMIIEEDTTISLINGEFETLSGYSKEETEGKKSWKEFFTEDYLDDMIRHHNLRRADPDSAPKQYETGFITRKGDVKHVIVTVSMIPGTNQSFAFLLDISERKQAEAELRFSEERFSKAFNACPGPMSISTFPDGRYIDVNEAFLQVLGYRREEVIGFTRSELNIWDLPEDLERATQSIYDNKLFHDLEASIRTKSGELRIGLISGDIIDISGGKYMLFVFDDITERKMAEEALKQSEEKYRSLIANLNDVIFTVNAEGYVTYISPVVERFAGYKAVEMIGKPFMSYVHPEDMQGLLESFGRSLSGQIEPVEFRLFRKDGASIYVRSLSRVLAENGQVSLAGVLSDITLRKLVEQETREQLHFLQVLNDAIPSPIYYKNLDWVFQGCNKAFADVFGLAKEDIIGKTSYDISPKELADSYYKMDMELLRRRSVQNFEGKLRYTDGIDHDVIFHKAPYEDIEGRLAGLVGVIIDVTEKKKIEAQQILSQKLESIGQLAAGIAHEINTPMQYLGDNTRFLRDGFTDICKLIEVYRHLIASIEENIPAGPLASVRELEKQIDVGFLTAEIPQAIDQSLDGIARVSKLVLAMKDFSHSGSREKTLSDINKAIEGTATISKNEWKYVADLELDLEQGLPLVNCAIDEINQVVLNMIVNSAQAIGHARGDQGINSGSGKGRITIKTRNSGDVVQIVISDTGIGIPQSIMHRIFDPFFTTKEVGKGTGQGLAITHDIIVNKHGGSIQVESEAGVGTTFTIQLPLCDSLNKEQ